MVAVSLLWPEAAQSAEPEDAEAVAAWQEGRPLLEFEIHGGIALPDCDCGWQEVGAGPTVGGLALLRPLRRLSLGLMADYVPFPWDAVNTNFHEPDAAMYSVMVGGAARFYFVEMGRIDAYLQLGAGYGAIEPSEERMGCGISSDLGVQGAIGLDVYTTDWLRVGGSTAYTRLFPTSNCASISMPDAPPPPPYLVGALSFRLGGTFATLY